MNKILKENKLVYIPAILPSKGLFEQKKGFDYSPNFWSNNAIWDYNIMLISAYHGKSIENVHDEFGVKDDVFILGDSGGFQLVTLGGSISPEEVIKWQKQNCSAGLILDRPPYHFGGNAQFSGTPTKEFFNECLNIKKNNAKVALKNKENLILYGVIQGETYEQMCQWYEEMHNLEKELNIEFDAWALSPKPSDNPIKVALFAILSQEYKIKKPMHILQISGGGGILTSAFFRNMIQETVTIDSSSYSGASRYGQIISPLNIPSCIPIGNKLEKNNKKGWFCDCPVCSKLNMDLSTMTDKHLGYLDIHNLYQIAKLVKYADYISQFDDIILTEAKREGQRCYISIEMLIFYRDNGFSKTMVKYLEYFKQSEDNKQNSLFDF